MSLSGVDMTISLFVFLIGSCKQNGVSLLTPVSDSIFIALSDGTFLFSLHGSFKNHQHKALWLAVGIVSTNQVMVKWATIQSKMNGTIWKSIENLIRNWCQKFHTILLRVISLKNKQWHTQYQFYPFRCKAAPLSAITEVTAAVTVPGGQSPNQSGGSLLDANSPHHRKLQQLLLYLRCMHLLAQTLDFCKAEFKAKKLKPSTSVKNSESWQYELSIELNWNGMTFDINFFPMWIV